MAINLVSLEREINKKINNTHKKYFVAMIKKLWNKYGDRLNFGLTCPKSAKFWPDNFRKPEKNLRNQNFVDIFRKHVGSMYFQNDTIVNMIEKLVRKIQIFKISEFNIESNGSLK